MSSKTKVLLAVLVALVILPALLSACPLCKDAVADGEYPGGAASLGSGFYWSILLMVAAPFSLVGILAFRIYRSRRKTRERLPAERPSPRLIPDSRGARL